MSYVNQGDTIDKKPQDSGDAILDFERLTTLIEAF